MTTHQIYFDRKGESSSGIAVLFFLLGVPSIYSALQQRSQVPAASHKSPVWAVGVGILAFAMAGAWSCVSAMG